MRTRYKIIISNKNLYKEIELSTEADYAKIGTEIDCDFRLHRDLFFEPVCITLNKKDDKWFMICSDNLYISTGDVRKLITKELRHGDNISIKYQNSNNELFNLEFDIDFNDGNIKYERAFDVSACSTITIGTDRTSGIVIRSNYTNNDNIVLKRNGNSFVLNIKNTFNGIYHNGQLAKNGEIVRNGDFISISDCFFYLKDNKLWTETGALVSSSSIRYEDNEEAIVYPKFNRNTRLKTKLNDEKIEVLDPPKKPDKPKTNLLLQLLPALAMIVMIIVVRGFMGNGANSSFIIFSVFSMSIGVVTSIVTIFTDKKKYKEESEQRIVKYHEYIDKKKATIETYRYEELNALNDIYISPEQEIENVSSFSGDLFDKVIEDDDFLKIKIGYGVREANRKVSFKKQERFETDDDLVELPAKLFEDTKNINDAPIELDLKSANAIGIIGSDEHNYSFVKYLVLDICTRHYYNDVNIFFLIKEDDAPRITQWLRWLPHVYGKNSGVRQIVFDDSSRSFIFEKLYVELNQRNQNKSEKTKNHNVYNIVFVLDDWGIKTHPVSQFISQANQLDTAFLFFENEKYELPLGCDNVITLKNNSNGELIRSELKDQVFDFEYRDIDDQLMINISLKLAPVFCEEISLENSLTKNITLFELFNILSAEDLDLDNRWRESEIYKSMSAPIGVKTKNEIVSLDLHEKAHGPHGLVAGTTGSGKSEILQTYILSMATLFHPYEVGFVIIDFKGGGMVNQFKDLPHLLGAITNIDGREIDRSLMSIKAELQKRQRLFAENDVNNINNYIKLYKAGKISTPIPHLILIVDEFAELKADQPEFMKELISTARIGRSLGVHLILATQKPAGQVNEQIWSNSRFKLCLKVQTKEDSNEVLKSPLAVEIKEPGRAYLQVGNNEVFELFQSAYSGAPAHMESSSEVSDFYLSEVDLCGRRKIVYQQKKKNTSDLASTQLDSVVEYIHEYCMKNSIEKLSNICLPPLEDVIYYKSMQIITGSMSVSIGVYDDPSNQTQDAAMLNVSAGNTVIVGSAQYGKTNLLQLIIRSLSENYSPNEVNIYVLDFGSMALRSFENLHHVGGVVISSEDERVKNLFRLLTKEISARKEKFSQLGITSFNSYIEAGYVDLPRVVLMIDNFIAFKELYSEFEDEMLSLCREGVALGISVIATSLQTNGISYKYMSNFSNRICLFCNSNDEYSTLFDRCRMEPKSVPGRGIIQIDKQLYEAQTYLAFDGEREIDRVAAIQEFVESINARFSHMRAKLIPSIPNLLDYEYFKDINISLKPYQIIVGLDYNSIETQSIDLSRLVTLGITGREKSGKTNFAKLIFDYCLTSVFDYPTKAYIIDDYDRQLEQFSSYGFVERYTVDANALDVILPEIEDELKRRKTLLQEEGIAFLEQEPLLICAIENQSVFDNGTLSKQTVDTYKRIISNYKQLKVLFVFTNIPNVSIAYGSPDLLKQMKEINNLFIFDDLSNVKLVDFNAATLRQYKKPIETGDAYRVLADGTINKIRTVKSNERSVI